jgi:fructose-bisphosphate aldolase class II
MPHVTTKMRRESMFIHKGLVSGKELLRDAVCKKIAVGAFNFTNMELLQAIAEGANEAKASVILQVSEAAIRYMGFAYIKAMVTAAVDCSSVPMVLHLDHGKDFDLCKTCIDEGFSSVMIDASSQSLDENIRITRAVTRYAEKFGVSVEAELGALCGVEDDIEIEPKNAFYTKPEEAAIFVNQTRVDSLAVAIGTSHGMSKGKCGTSPKLSIDTLRQIKAQVGDCPLVLHGASSVYQDLVVICNENGAELRNTIGISDSDITESIKHGIAKVNVDTDIRLAFMGALRKALNAKRSSIDMRGYLAEAKSAARHVILRKIRTFM